ncbi:efflux transporter periplasmic adaptor subunit [Alkalilimnicola ehrlichii]|uniref:Efflux transporter periplasmic adaptor subunit n=1 Tax=Alkalilimnicola ehrlichii TaxID=351052 RepID=A0A3E0WQA6_9GAMM|nr:efflux RND transporter periplasmic adaptor subunit [Alkalilimnicola ehrlichii]RFA27944.1 efflux transporter periplasmic adaptor subunit [Alkalilimnicola ehrlichii]RFA34589.1 efflux transporter periplasmic adaptor subunit [Alkalilimnicola ehrlichii]
MRVPGGTRIWLIVGVLALVVIWIASGVLLRDGEPEAAAGPPEDQRTAVAVRVSQAEPVERLLVLQGDLRPEQVVLVRAETGGQVLAWQVPRGAAVSSGDLLAELELGERESQLRQAQAQVNVAEHQLRATRQLVEDGYEPEIQLDSALAELEAAQAQLAAIEEDIDRTRIRAPIPGRVNERIAERGDFVAAGGEVAQIVNNDPLRATVQVPQHSIDQVEVGQSARVNILRFGVVEGEVTFVSTFADPATRTFVVEVEIPNQDQILPAGTSAEVEIPTQAVPAHLVSPAIIGLDDEGRVGVKTVDDRGRVVFHPIEVVRAERQGLWVAGLPEEARIITVGQGFVRAGEDVIARAEEVLEVGQAEEGEE